MQSLALCVWFCAFCHAVPQWSNLPQNPQALMLQQTDQRLQKQVGQQFPQWVQQQANQQVQKQASQQSPQWVQTQANQQVKKQTTQHSSQWVKTQSCIKKK